MVHAGTVAVAGQRCCSSWGELERAGHRTRRAAPVRVVRSRSCCSSSRTRCPGGGRGVHGGAAHRVGRGAGGLQARAAPQASVLPLDVRTIPWGAFRLHPRDQHRVRGLAGMVNTFAEGDAAFTAKALLLAGCALAAITPSMVVAPSAAEPIALYRPSSPRWWRAHPASAAARAVPLPGRGLVIMGVYCLDMFMMLVSHRRGVPRAGDGAVVRPGHPLRPHRHAHRVVRRGPATERCGRALRSRCSSWACWRSCWWAAVLAQTDVQKLYATSREKPPTPASSRSAPPSRGCAALTNRGPRCSCWPAGAPCAISATSCPSRRAPRPTVSNITARWACSTAKGARHHRAGRRGEAGLG